MAEIVNLQYKIRLLKGHLDVMEYDNPDYPGIDIEYVADNEDKYVNVTRPRVVVEQTKDKGLRVLVWADTKNEDYSHEIVLEENYAAPNDYLDKNGKKLSIGNIATFTDDPYGLGVITIIGIIVEGDDGHLSVEYYEPMYGHNMHYSLHEGVNCTVVREEDDDV